MRTPNTDPAAAGRIADRRHRKFAFLAALVLIVLLGPGAADALAPAVTIQPASQVGVTAAAAEGQVDPEGAETNWHFETITEERFQENLTNSVPSFEGAAGQGGGTIAAGEPAAPVSARLEGLAPHTTYHLRLVAENTAGEREEAMAPTFTTAAAISPTVELKAPVGVSYRRLKLEGSVNPEGGNQNPGASEPLPISWELQLAPNSEPGNWQFAQGGTIEGAEAESTSAIPVSAVFTALQPATGYTARLLVRYAGLEATAPQEPTATTLAVIAPTVTLEPVTTFNGSTAHFVGTVNPNSPKPEAETSEAEQEAFATTWHIECTPECPGLGQESLAADNTAHAIHVTAEHLIPGTTYQVRLIATDSGGESVAGPQSFATQTVAPEIVSTFASGVSREGADLGARVNPGGASTTYAFQYLTEAEFNGSGFAGAEEAKGPAAIGPAAQVDAVHVPVDGLKSETAYVFRLIATNSVEEVTGPIETFTTEETAEPTHECPNERLREESSLDPETERPYSIGLPNCRAFEQVTPPFKGVAVFAAQAFSPDGSRLISGGVSSVAGSGSGDTLNNPYEITRTPTGWQTTALLHPPMMMTSSFSPATGPPTDWAGDVLLPVHPPGSPVGEEILYLRHPSGELTEVGPLVSPSGLYGYVNDNQVANGYQSLIRGVSADLSDVVFAMHVHENLNFPGIGSWPGDTSVDERDQFTLYEYHGTDNSEPELVGVSNQGHAPWLPGAEHLNEGAHLISDCGTMLGGPYYGYDTYNAISADGETVYFSAMPQGYNGCGDSGPPVVELYSRLHRETTAPISEPPLQAHCTGECEEDATDQADFRNASYQAASIDGSKVFFLSTQRLLDSATQDPDPEDQAAGIFGSERCSHIEGSNGCNLYEYDFSKPVDERLVDLSAGAPLSEGPQVRGVGIVSEDGSHVYFVARGVLTGTQENSYGLSARSGAENLYVYDTDTSHLTFIAALSERDEGQWEHYGRMQTTPDGRFLLFTTVADPTPDAEGEARQLYRYDSSTDRLVRVSFGVGGLSRDGNAAGSVELPLPNTSESLSDKSASPAIANDGTVVFDSEGALAPGAIEGSENVYEYDHGHLYLIASSHDDRTDAVGIDHSGRDIFLQTNLALVPGDADTAGDIYDAREDGGFPAPAEPPTCSGEPCQGSSSPSPSEAGASTPNFSGAEEGPRHPQKPKARRRKHHHKHHKHHKKAAHRRTAGSRGGHR